MAGYSIGKEFEERFKQDWKESFPNAFLMRLHDQVSGYKTISQNPCDFIAYNYPFLFLIECKTCKDNTFAFSKFTQYERLRSFKGIFGLIAGVVIYYYNVKKVIFVPIGVAEKLKNNGAKSIRYDSEGVIELGSVPLRTFMKTNYEGVYEYGKHIFEQCG